MYDSVVVFEKKWSMLTINISHLLVRLRACDRRVNEFKTPASNKIFANI